MDQTRVIDGHPLLLQSLTTTVRPKWTIILVVPKFTVAATP